MRVNISSVIVGSAAAALLLISVQIKSSGQTPTAAGKAASPAARPAARKAPVKTPMKAVAQPPTAAAFKAATDALFNGTCFQCHNDLEVAGGIDFGHYLSVQSLSTDRDLWDLVLAKIKAGEMPPADAERPPAEQVSTLVKFLEAEFERADANLKPDPGRVTAGTQRAITGSPHPATLPGQLASCDPTGITRPAGRLRIAHFCMEYKEE